MGKMKFSLLAVGCLLAAFPVLFEMTVLARVLLVMVYGFLGVVLWLDCETRRETTWVTLALLLFSVMVGLQMWHRVFRVAFWLSFLYTEVGESSRKAWWWVEALVWFVAGVSLVCVVSSWQWWVALVDMVGWLLLGFMVVQGEREGEKREIL